MLAVEPRVWFELMLEISLVIPEPPLKTVKSSVSVPELPSIEIEPSLEMNVSVSLGLVATGLVPVIGCMVVNESLVDVGDWPATPRILIYSAPAVRPFNIITTHVDPTAAR